VTDIVDFTGIWPASVGGSSSTYIADYFYTYFDNDNDSGWRVARVGARATNGSVAGAFCVYSINDSSYAASTIGGRLAYDGIKSETLYASVVSDYVNAATVPAKARFESDGLLVEGEAINLLPYSEDFSEWTSTMGSVTANLTGPDGESNSAYTITADDANDTLKYTPSVTLGGTAEVFSIWMKRVTGSGAVNITEDDGTTWVEKTLTTSWQRFNVTGTETNPVVGIQIETDTDAIGIYGAQLEDGYDYVTSYVPTDGVQAVRTTEAGDGTYGVNWTLESAVTNILGDATANGTLIVEYTPGLDETDLAAATHNVVSVRTSATSILFQNHVNWQSADGTNTPSEENGAYSSGDSLILTVRWHEANSDFTVSKKFGGSWLHGSTLDFDGAFIETGNLYLHYGNEYPAHIGGVWMYDEYLTDEQVEAEVWSGKSKFFWYDIGSR
jgi:hypothetical protein